MLEEKIMNDYKDAMKNKDSLKSSVLSFLRAQMMNTVIEKKKKALDDAEVVSVIKKQIKQRQDSIEQFTKGNRLDLADKEKGELEILKSYLPEQISPEELARIIDETIADLGAAGMKDMGRVMKEVSAKAGPSLDSKQASDMVRGRLSKNG